MPRLDVLEQRAHQCLETVHQLAVWARLPVGQICCRKQCQLLPRGSRSPSLGNGFWHTRDGGRGGQRASGSPGSGGAFFSILSEKTGRDMTTSDM